ncbi:pyridoxamine 5'-phosphate oxidase family protein [Dactylosporangium aurantiacum]|uniref:Pyridoxamine 5'-phosphate oxidase family protein n=1 Tax=Dactylosporangium aurantiacum TaxID=35754 RepID=A0A9Q9MHW0_9ACTN|nr:pyridoxamine 5'-phosphate oxidase family protein [Dactylosporangium aurantiacum]MDG6108518.1 pyridoxamine 5'-phosphate oxidase family protein [Dactylosporangium aurantiacum]UWZ57189.1 pyridoxamine 5'-phosphate oxidase family protein [Dactylosporangium aurantiacum]
MSSVRKGPGVFHEGELAVQERAGVRQAAARLTGMLAPGGIGRGAGGWLAERTLAVLSARDRAGRLWASALTGPPGFLDGAGPRLRVHAFLTPGDPLHDLPVGQRVGLIAIDFATRRRMRVNGTLSFVDPAGPASGLTVEVAEAFGNCPQYIQPRRLAGPAGSAAAPVFAPLPALTAADAALVAGADTFFLGTAHPQRGADASHRGGPRGFLRVEGGDLWWPDYPGNNMFNSLGNLAADPSAALLVPDFRTGRTLHLSGSATVEWTAPGTGAADEITGRRVRFRPTAVVAGDHPALVAA